MKTTGAMRYLVAVGLLGVAGAVLADWYFENCYGCSPSNPADPSTAEILTGWGQTAQPGDQLTITNAVPADSQGSLYYQRYRLDVINGVYQWTGVANGTTILASTGGAYGGNPDPSVLISFGSWGYSGHLINVGETWCIDSFIGNDRYDTRCIYI